MERTAPSLTGRGFARPRNLSPRSSTLPPAVKTIVTDLYYHYGEYSSFPNFETAISQSDWLAAIRELRNWNGTPNSTDPSDGIARRLNNRADYLQRSLGL